MQTTTNQFCELNIRQAAWASLAALCIGVAGCGRCAGGGRDASLLGQHPSSYLISTDGYAGGNTSVDPELAYRYARGIPVIHPTAHTRVTIERPLDFLVVSDHAELYGFQAMLDRDDPRLMATQAGRHLRDCRRPAPAPCSC